MNFTLTFTIDEVNLILRRLDEGPHREVRPLIDKIIAEVTAQQKQGLLRDAAEAAAQVQGTVE